jgi:hypothetical protein
MSIKKELTSQPKPMLLNVQKINKAVSQKRSPDQPFPEPLGKLLPNV